MANYQQLKKWISQDRLDLVFDALIPLLESKRDTRLQNELIQLKARKKDFDKRFQNGQVHSQELDITSNQTRVAVLNLIEDCRGLGYFDLAEIPASRKTIMWSLLLLLALAAAFSLYFLFPIGFEKEAGSNKDTVHKDIVLPAQDTKSTEPNGQTESSNTQSVAEQKGREAAGPEVPAKAGAIADTIEVELIVNSECKDSIVYVDGVEAIPGHGSTPTIKKIQVGKGNRTFRIGNAQKKVFIKVQSTHSAIRIPLTCD